MLNVDESVGAQIEAAMVSVICVRTRSPETPGRTTTVFELHVDDVDAAFKRVLDTGAQVKLYVSR
ncbi:MAG: hypothetical protein ABS35_28235 [Kaistia sp. SCN 65-12]|nr:MAG: hypothetical protein ABS35_28235 [Kaistia sp. SCN 65-12]